MMTAKSILLIALMSICTGISAPVLSQPRAYSFEAVDTLLKVQPRPVMVYVYTDWCRHCGAMKNSTLKNTGVISQLDTQFYFVMLNAEEQVDIRLGGRTFRFRPTGAGTGVHELATALAGDKMGYPLLCILNSNCRIIFQHSGFLSAAEFSALLHKVHAGKSSTPAFPPRVSDGEL